MSVKVKSIDEQAILQKIKELGDKDIINYVRSLNELVKIQKDSNKRMLGEIIKLSSKPISERHNGQE